MVKLVCVNGHPGCGKTTFEDLLTDCCPNRIYKYSTIDLIKEAALVLGWDGTKTPRNRQFLSDLKDLSTKWDNVPFKAVMREKARIERMVAMYDLPQDYIILLMVDSREPEELARFKEAGAYTLKIERAAVDSLEQSNHADAETDNFDYDFVIENNGTLDELKVRAMSFYEIIHTIERDKLNENNTR